MCGAWDYRFLSITFTNGLCAKCTTRHLWIWYWPRMTVRTFSLFSTERGTDSADYHAYLSIPTFHQSTVVIWLVFPCFHPEIREALPERCNYYECRKSCCKKITLVYKRTLLDWSSWLLHVFSQERKITSFCNISVICPRWQLLQMETSAFGVYFWEISHVFCISAIYQWGIVIYCIYSIGQTWCPGGINICF